MSENLLPEAESYQPGHVTPEQLDAIIGFPVRDAAKAIQDMTWVYEDDGSLTVFRRPGCIVLVRRGDFLDFTGKVTSNGASSPKDLTPISIMPASDGFYVHLAEDNHRLEITVKADRNTDARVQAVPTQYWDAISAFANREKTSSKPKVSLRGILGLRPRS